MLLLASPQVAGAFTETYAPASATIDLTLTNADAGLSFGPSWHVESKYHPGTGVTLCDPCGVYPDARVVVIHSSVPIDPKVDDLNLDDQVFSGTKPITLTYDLTDSAARASTLDMEGGTSFTAVGNGFDITGDGIADIVIAGARLQAIYLNYKASGEVVDMRKMSVQVQDDDNSNDLWEPGVNIAAQSDASTFFGPPHNQVRLGFLGGSDSTLTAVTGDKDDVIDGQYGGGFLHADTGAGNDAVTLPRQGGWANLGPGDDDFGSTTGVVHAWGGPGNDSLMLRGKGVAWLRGGPGNDELYARRGIAHMWGNAGDDNLMYTSGGNRLRSTYDCGAGLDYYFGPSKPLHARRCEYRVAASRCIPWLGEPPIVNGVEDLHCPRREKLLGH